MTRATVVFLVNGDRASAMAIRARSFEERLAGDFRIHIAYRPANKIYAILYFFLLLVRLRPAVTYVLDMGFSGVLAAGLYRSISRSRTVVDTGDAIYELSRLAGNRGRVSLWLTKWLERYAFSIGGRVVVRSHPHQELLARQGIEADAIPDGVDPAQFYPRQEPELRQKYNLEGFTVIGVLGSLIWNRKSETCYGWELVELIGQMRNRPVKGFIIGDGSGLRELKTRCERLGIADRIVFSGRIRYDELPQYLNLMDICLSTQTNDRAGEVRTTGKLPLYLACGRFVLASEVGEAARVLPAGMLVPYNGTLDREYPGRLAGRIEALLNQPGSIEDRAVSVAIARTHFDYGILAERVRETICGLLEAGAEKSTAGAWSSAGTRAGERAGDRH